MVVDTLVREFFERHPGGLAVGLLPGLCTRFSRVDNGALRWLDLESAEIAAFKSGLLRTPDRHVIAQCCSIACAGWMKLLADAGDMPILIVAQGGFRRAPIEVRDAFITNAALHLPAGVELVIEYDAHAPLRPSSLRNGGASLSTLDASGAWATYPRIRFVRSSEHSEGLDHKLAGVNAVSRLFRGRGAPSVAHLRFT
jgi:O-methyltransferase involved in polyketide biosynthesis